MGSRRMNHLKVFLLLFCTADSSAQDAGSKSRFDKILQDVGFTGVGAAQPGDISTFSNERKQTEKAPARPASSSQRLRDVDIQTNTIPDFRPKAQPPQQVESSAALAALFSVAGRPEGTKTQANNFVTNNRKLNQKPKLPIAQVLNERFENPVFESDKPSRRIVNNRGLISSERRNRNKGSRRNKDGLTNNASTSNARNKGTRVPTLNVRKQLPIPDATQQKFTSGGIPIVGSVPAVITRTGVRAPNVQAPKRNNSPHSVPTISSNAGTEKNERPVVDPVAKLVTIASATVPRVSTGSQVRVGLSTDSGRQPVVPETKSVKSTGVTTGRSKQSTKNAFNFEETLKEFGFSPRLISGTSFKNGNAPVPSLPSSQDIITRNPFTSPQVTTNAPQQISNTQSKGFSNVRRNPAYTSGLNSLIALAGDPENNPVSKTSKSIISFNNPALTQGKSQEVRKSSNARLSPTNSALGNLQSIASGKGPTFTVKNRARGQARNPGGKLPNVKNPPNDAPAPINLVKTTEKTPFEINPFINENLQKQQLETSRSKNIKINENSKNVPRSQTVAEDERNNARINIPRKKSSSNSLSKAKIIISEDEFEDSFEENSTEKRTEQREEKKKEKEDRRHKPKKKRPLKGKKQQKIEQRPPVVGGCFHVCETLIFEVYKLLGGSLCDCVR